MSNEAGSDQGSTTSLPRSAAALALLTAMLWGGTAVSTRFAVDAVPPLAVAAIRFAIAAVFMLGWCRWERAPLRLRRDQLGPSLIAGFLLFVQIATFSEGTFRSTASHVTLFINTFVFWVAAIEHFVTRAHRLTGRQVSGLFVAAAGVVLLVAATAGAEEEAAGRDSNTLLGDGLLLTSALLLAIKVVYTRFAVRTVPPGTLTLWHDVFGVLLFVIYSALFETVDLRSIEAPAVWAIAYVGLVVSGFCFAAQAWLLKRYSASLISVFSFSTPVFGVALAVVLRGDSLSPWLLASGAAVAVGILLVTQGPTRDDR